MPHSAMTVDVLTKQALKSLIKTTKIKKITKLFLSY